MSRTRATAPPNDRRFAGWNLFLRPALRTVNGQSAILFHNTSTAPFARLGQKHLQFEVTRLGVDNGQNAPTKGRFPAMAAPAAAPSCRTFSIMAAPTEVPAHRRSPGRTRPMPRTDRGHMAFSPQQRARCRGRPSATDRRALRRNGTRRRSRRGISATSGLVALPRSLQPSPPADLIGVLRGSIRPAAGAAQSRLRRGEPGAAPEISGTLGR
jgi:hypothetical protein